MSDPNTRLLISVFIGMIAGFAMLFLAYQPSENCTLNGSPYPCDWLRK